VGRFDGLKFGHLQVGDIVFVVPQPTKYRPNPEGEYQPVVKVGKKYISILSTTGKPLPFDPDTGHSVHPGDCNARANNWGFDVYWTEDEYLATKHAWREFCRMKRRLLGDYGGISKLPAHTVAEIHAALDRAGIDSKEEATNAI
jgi:hypothetical protein